MSSTETGMIRERSRQDPPAPPATPRRSVPGELREILAHDLWQHRELAFQLTLRDVRIRYKQAVMGFAWAVLMPALVVSAGALVRYAMAYVGGTEVALSAIAGMAVKALPWAFFVGAIGFGVNALTGNAQLVTKIYFPREVLPVSAVMAQAVDSLVGTVTLLLALPLLGVSFGLSMLWTVPIAITLFVFTVGSALFLSCANLFFRDVKYIVQVLLMFGIFFTPVFFEPQMFGPIGARIMMLNPLAPMLEGLRLSIVDGHDLLQPLATAASDGREIVVWSPWYLVYSVVWAFGGATAAALLFHRSEFVFAEYA